MEKRLFDLTVRLSLLAGALVGIQSSDVMARGGFATENPLAAEHIDALPADIRRSVAVRQRECGTEPAAGHYFSVSIEASGRRFVAMHFDQLYCPGNRNICDASGCLHEVFVEKGGRHIRVFAAHVDEIRLTNTGDAAGLDIIRGGSTTSLIWNGRQFVPRKGSRL